MDHDFISQLSSVVANLAKEVGDYWAFVSLCWFTAPKPLNDGRRQDGLSESGSTVHPEKPAGLWSIGTFEPLAKISVLQDPFAGVGISPVDVILQDFRRKVNVGRSARLEPL